MAHDGEVRDNAPFRFVLIGRFSVLREGRPLAESDIGSRKGRTLLKLLLVNRGHVVSFDRIVEVLWGDRPPLKADENVSSLVSRLRGRFGPQAIQGGRSGYAFAPGPWADTDLDEAERLTAEAEARLGAAEPSLASIAAERTLDLLGPQRLLEEEAYPSWAEESQVWVDGLTRRARRSAWTAALELSDPRRAIEIAESAIAASALDEEPYRVLMRAHLLAGERAAALEAFERVRSALAEELGVDPSPETQTLHLSILREEPLIEETVTPRPTVQMVPEPGFVGREEELAQISDRWAEAAAGHPSLIVVTGEAGIGKTRLAREAVRVALRTGGRVMEARCYEQERSLFLQPILEALRGALVSLPPDLIREVVGDRAGTLSGLLPEVTRILRPIAYQPGTPEIERRRSFEAVTATFRQLAARQPVLLMLDDAHNAGASSLELLHYLMRRLSRDRLLVLATVRVEEGAEALGQLIDVGDLLDLGPLPDEAVALLARGMGAAHLQDRLLRLSRGHPLFVVEALRAMAEGAEGAEPPPVPESLRAAVLARVHRIGPEVEELLRAAAALGPAFDLPTTAELLGTSPEDAARRAERALQARLVVEAGPGYEFANDLIQEVLYQTTPLPTRTARHRRAAALLRDNPEAVAAHAAAAQDWSRALKAWLEAADRASSKFSNRDAEQLLDQAVGAAVRAGDRVGEARARLARARALEAMARYQQAHADQTAAVELARQTGEQAIEMRALRELGGDVLVGAGRQAKDTIPFLEAGLAIAERLGDGAEQIDLLNRLAVVWVNLLRFDLAFEHAERALTLARTLGDDRSQAIALDGLKTAAAYSGDLATLDKVLQELEPILQRLGDLWYLQWAVFESSFAPMARGQWDRAIDRIQEALALNQRTGHAGWRPMFVAHLGWIDRSRGDYGPALALGRQAVDLADEVGHPWWVAFAESMLGWTLSDLFAYQPAIAELERGRTAAERVGWESYLVRCLSHLALAHWGSGNRAAAIEPLERAEAILSQVATPPGGAFLHGGHAYLAAARVRLGMGDPGAAEGLVTAVLEPAEAAGWHEVAAGAALVTGLCRSAMGDPASAEEHVGRALELAERHGLPRVAWEAHAALGTMARESGREDLASSHGSSARSIVRGVAKTIDDEELRRTFVRRATSRAAPR